MRAILVLNLIIEGLATFGMGYIGSYESGFALRVITGLRAGVVFSACARAFMEWFLPKERVTAFGVMLGAPLGGIVLASLVMQPLNGALGWEGALKVGGLATVKETRMHKIAPTVIYY